MLKKNLIYCSAIGLLVLMKPVSIFSQDVKETVLNEKLFHYHNIHLNAAMKIANCLARNMVKGDENNSPLPFKVNAITGEVGRLLNNTGDGKTSQLSSYTSNWSGTMELFLNLIELKYGDTESYKRAFDTVLEWMKKYPLRNNKWGPFFEDVPGWSWSSLKTGGELTVRHQTGNNISVTLK
jgi:hypothetical protein